jgi:alcohol dehydrogenase class IV
VARLCGDLEIQALRAYGVRPADIPTLAEKAARASSMKANPIVLTPAQLEELLARAL